MTVNTVHDRLANKKIIDSIFVWHKKQERKNDEKKYIWNAPTTQTQWNQQNKNHENERKTNVKCGDSTYTILVYHRHIFLLFIKIYLYSSWIWWNIP